MSVTCAIALPGNRFHYHTEDEAGSGTLLLADLRNEYSSSDLLDRFRLLDPIVRNVDTVVFRGCDRSFAEQVDRHPGLRSIVSKSQRVWTLFSEDSGLGGTALGKMTLEPVTWSSVSASPDLNELRRLELATIFRKCGAIISIPSTHYLVPSGWHVAEFIRVANVLQDPGDVSRCSDWLLEHVPKAAAVLADTGTIMPLLQEVRHRAHLLGEQIHFDCLPTYPDSTESDVTNIVDRLLARIPGVGATLVCVLSVNSTGQVLRAVKTSAPEEFHVVAVCDASGPNQGSGSDCVSLLKHPVKRWEVDSEGRCSQCADMRSLLTVDSRTYTVRPAPPERVKLDFKVAEKTSEFWQIALSCEAVRLHADIEYLSADGQFRHYPIYLDVARLLGHTSFREKCRDALKKIPTPDVLLVPEHATTALLIDLARDAYPGLREGQIRTLPRSKLTQDTLDGIGPSSIVLILDDALVGGRTLTELRLRIYESTKERGAPLLYAFVLLNRATEASTRRMRNLYLDGRIVSGSKFLFGAAWSVPLPPVGRDQCPWCAEHDRLDEAVKGLSEAVRQTALERISRLQSELDEPLLMRCVHSPGRTLGSIFGPLDEKTGFAAACCALAMNNLEERSSVVNVEFSIDNFFDDIFLAATLRACDKGLLRDPDYDSDVSKAIKRRPFDPNQIAELGWAAYEGKIPHRAVSEILDQQYVSFVQLALVREMLRSRFG